jgi:hypothetical protein
MGSLTPVSVKQQHADGNDDGDVSDAPLSAKGRGSPFLTTSGSDSKDE